MGLVNGRGRFSTPTAPRPLDWFSWNLKYITISRTRPRMQNFTGLRRRGWSGQIASLTHESFCPFFSFLRHAHRSHFWTHPNAQYVIMRRSRQGSAFWGLERLNLKIWHPLPPKNVKIGTSSWQSMENCSRPHSGTVSCIMFKLGKRIDHPSGIMWHDSKFKRSRSQRNVTYPVKNCNNSVLGGRIKFILEK